MKRIHRIVAGTAGLLVLAAATAFAAAPGGGVGAWCGQGAGGAGFGPMGMMFGGAGPWGHRGMGPGGFGRMGAGHGYSQFAGLDLSVEQRKQIEQIEEETAKSRWQLMGTMREQAYGMGGRFARGPVDDEAARKAFDSMSATRKAMFELSLGERNRIDAVLTPAQREQLQRNSVGR